MDALAHHIVEACRVSDIGLLPGIGLLLETGLILEARSGPMAQWSQQVPSACIVRRTGRDPPLAVEADPFSVFERAGIAIPI